ncbi:MAG: 3-phosphoshikimate 1-carboxyvinyltransferase [Methanobacteriaceae archaeon]|nr:3-phosphoshikimate 1-carboxyvinyltransferase [Methanobacteriaceae archaeon]
MNLKIKNFSKIEGTVKAPPSKSYSHRAVIIASLADNTSKLYDVLYSEDVLASINACKSLGAKITKKEDEKGTYLEVIGTGGHLHNQSNDLIDLANSGTTLRIMTSVASLSDNEVTFTGDDSLKTRPMGPLLDALNTLGVETVSINNNDKAPLTIKPGFKGGNVSILGNMSSQFISSILISAPLSDEGVELSVLPKFVSKPYVDMTISVMEKFGVNIEKEDNNEDKDNKDNNLKNNQFDTKFIIPTQKYIATDYTVEGDYSSASYLLAACGIAGGEVTVQNLFKDSKQGDKLIIDILNDMGCEIDIDDSFVTIKSDGNLKSISEINLANAPDLLLTVAILAAIAEGETKITGIGHARLKETDRIDTTCRELEKLGCELQEFEDSIIIKGKTITGGVVNSHKDHRLAMAFSLLGLKENVEVEDGECFDVSFPNFIEAMAEIGLELELI